MLPGIEAHFDARGHAVGAEPNRVKHADGVQGEEIISKASSAANFGLGSDSEGRAAHRNGGSGRDERRLVALFKV
jgi:superfamily I DNA and/or RNA helicase